MRSRNGDGRSRSGNYVFLSRFELVRLRQRALRRGVWYKVLNRIERSLVDLAIVTVSKIRSLVLARSLVFIVEKLRGVIGSDIERRIQTVGFPLARKASDIAQKWGNASAFRWACDLGFASFLAICVADVSG